MEIENHIYVLHRFENGVVHLVALDATIRVCGDAARVRFDAYDAGLLREPDLIRGKIGREIKRHKIFDGWVYSFE